MERELLQIRQVLDSFFQGTKIQTDLLLEKLLAGELFGALTELIREVLSGIGSETEKYEKILVWLLLLGFSSALLNRFIGIFDRHQVADLGFYFIYLITVTFLMQCYVSLLEIAGETLENMLIYLKLLIPTYIVTIGVACGSTGAGMCYEGLLLLIYFSEVLFQKIVFPMITLFFVVSVLNETWKEERLSMMLKLIHRAICFLLKAGVVTVTGFSMFQSALAPALDVVKNSAWEKALAALPGVGDAADGVIRLVIGSAVLIKNSVGILLFLLLIALCITPMLRMFITTFVIKFAAALMSVVGERRITLCTDHAAEAGLLLLQTLGTALLFFFISFSAIVLAVGRTW